ncbi:hypothetical protein KOY49_03425 [Candidatus Minimicrobia vallesae]|uniref:Uncharacterized protein n=1 Tax=Candidatus Minimicrobia vallesae TaxID=2841264 RepID=A0A8F1SA76_9BACT|nr:hypothetical protein [Candidatus Minimicrobia vallesae]QWQ31219.1 hypothetical protein KOY49_03425 [Candidatus Minimicrobia vallesae]
MWRNKKTFLALIIVMSILTFALASVMSQDTYQQLKDVMNQAELEWIRRNLYNN